MSGVEAWTRIAREVAVPNKNTLCPLETEPDDMDMHGRFPSTAHVVFRRTFQNALQSDCPRSQTDFWECPVGLQEFFPLRVVGRLRIGTVSSEDKCLRQVFAVCLTGY